MGIECWNCGYCAGTSSLTMLEYGARPMKASVAQGFLGSGSEQSTSFAVPKGIAERIDTVGARRAEAAGIGPWGELRSGLMRYPAAWPASGMAAGLGGGSLFRGPNFDSGEGAAPRPA